ncbi:MAG: PaaI family thioesterase [Deltaproteobacteria bacterium]|nr:PaaI family thioesterase [Deltaproteobacteria bacterium]
MATGRTLPMYAPCFICGGKNACGAQMAWSQSGEGVEGRTRGAERHCGFEGILHGGVIAGLLDECAGWAAALRCRAMCFTGELKVRYLRPVPTGHELVIRGTCRDDAQDGRKYVVASAEIAGADGTPYATCEGKFFPMPPHLGSAVLAKLELPAGAAAESVADYLWRPQAT